MQDTAHTDSLERVNYELTGLFILLLVTLWTYAGSLNNPFQFDDSLFLQSPQVSEPGDPWYLLKPTQTRQLAYLSFYFNYRIGGADPRGYHLINLLLHLANVAAVFWFARLLLRFNHSEFDLPAQKWIPLAAAGVFALHPVQSEAVNYVYQRSTLLAAFFTLLAMSSFLNAQKGGKRTAWYAVSLGCFFLAVASKESALVLPFVWIAFVWARSRDSAIVRPLSRLLLRYWIPLTATVLTGAMLLFNLWRRGEQTLGLSLIQSAPAYLMAQFQVLAAYLRLLIIPSGLSVDHDFQPSPWCSAYAVLCGVMFLCLVALAVYLRKRRTTIAFLIFAFFLFLAPTSSIIPSQDLMFEHRLYLPMIALSILCGWALDAGAHRLSSSERRRTAVYVGCVAGLLGCCSVVARERTYVWGSSVRLWEDAARKAPNKARVHYNLGIAYLNLDPGKAKRELLRTVAIDPAYAPAYYNLGWLAQNEGDYEAARRDYEETLEADPRMWQAHHNLGNIDTLQGLTADAMAEFEAAIRQRSDYWPSYLNLAALQVQVGDPLSALRSLEMLKKLRWDNLDARYLSAYALIQLSRFAEADNELRFLEAHDPDGVFRLRIAELRSRIPAPKKNPR